MKQELIFRRIADGVDAAKAAGNAPSSPLGLGQIIIDIIDKLIGSTDITVEGATAAAKQFYNSVTSGDNPQIPNWIEVTGERLAWMVIEIFIRRLFSRKSA